MINIYKKLLARNGFTLAEVMVAMGIFSIASVIISSVYLNTNTLHQHTANFQKLQNDGRYIIEKIAREIRAREIEYPVMSEQDHIEFLKDELGNQVSIALLGTDLEYIVNGTSANLNADDVEITDVKFYIIPISEDKWNTEPTTNKQPRVAIFLKLKNKNINPKFQKEISIQTTISSKVYKR
ncbi:MAG: prepilin-type N-terminal cleavage/methylation domain-containing protein [Patescibacteria group bacterium]|mgnify:CR=1 FL=1